LKTLVFEKFYKLIYNQLVTNLLRYAGKLIICDDTRDTFAMGCVQPQYLMKNQFQHLGEKVG
jgi:hypothetical protein